MTGHIHSLVARNVARTTEALPTVQPRLRARFEPFSLAERLSLDWEPEIDVERNALPAEHAARTEIPRTTPRVALASETAAADGTVLRPVRPPAEPPPALTVTHLERTIEIVRRVERLAEPPRHEPGALPTPDPDAGRSRASLSLEPEQRLESQAHQAGELDAAAHAIELPEAADPAPWRLQPQNVSVETPCEPQPKQPVAAPLSQTPPSAPTAPPPVQVTIGRLEVRAVPPSQAARGGRKPQAGQGLHEYLRRSAKR